MRVFCTHHYCIFEITCIIIEMSLIALRPSEMKLLKFCELLYDWKCEVQFLWWLLQDCVFCFCCWSACCVLCVVCIIFHCILFWNIVLNGIVLYYIVLYYIVSYCIVLYCAVSYRIVLIRSSLRYISYFISCYALPSTTSFYPTVCNRLPYFITSYTPIIFSSLLSLHMISQYTA